MSTRIKYLHRLCLITLLLFPLLFCSFTCQAAPLEVEHVCGYQEKLGLTAPKTGWSEGPGTIYPGSKFPGYICWVKIANAPSNGQLISFKGVWIDIILFDSQQREIGRAIHGGLHSKVSVSANRITFITPPLELPLYARLEVSPTTAYYDQVEVEALGLDEANRLSQSFDSISVAQAAILIGFTFLTATFGCVLRNLTYLLFSLYCFFRAAFLIFNNGLIFSLWEIPNWMPSLFIFTAWPASALQSIIITRMAGFAEHSPRLHYSMLIIAIFFVCLAPLDIYFPYKSLIIQDYIEIVWFPILLFGVGKAVYLRRSGSAILFLGTLQMTAFWWPLALAHASAHLFPNSLDWSYEIPSGSTFDIIQNLFFPTLFCLSIAYRTLLLHRDAIRIAREDKLTGLPNRERFTQHGDWILKSNAESTICVAAINVDRFKAINETLGFDIGDATLIAVARRLVSVPGTIVARGQSDQFLLLLMNALEVDDLKRKIQQLFFAPIIVNQQTIDISLSVGIVSDKNMNMRLQMRCAEIALNVARNEKTGWEVYKPEMETSKLGDLRLLSELRTAIEENQLLLYLQPKIRVKDGAIVSAEALVRWEHPERGMIPPSQFIPFAEHTGHISAITVWMLTEAMQIVTNFRRLGTPLQISVNLSAFDLRNNHIVTILETLRETHGALAMDIRLEVTESSVMSHPEVSLLVLHALHARGYSISIDDFGTGYSSLAYLQKMPVTELKIDRAFVAGVLAESDAATLLLSTIELGQRLKLSVVAEGVENAEEWALLKQFGCDYIQGWFAAKAMPISDFAIWRQENSPFNDKP